MIRTLLFLIALMVTWGASAQGCQPLTLAALKQVYKASNRSDRIFAEGFSLPLAKSDNSIVYHRCRKVIDYSNEVQTVSMPELMNDGRRSRTIWFATYDRDIYLNIKTRAQASYQVLPSLKSQSGPYSLGYTDGKTAYLFGATTLDSTTGATRFRIALMPLSSL